MSMRPDKPGKEAQEPSSRETFRKLSKRAREVFSLSKKSSTLSGDEKADTNKSLAVTEIAFEAFRTDIVAHPELLKRLVVTIMRQLPACDDLRVLKETHIEQVALPEDASFHAQYQAVLSSGAYDTLNKIKQFNCSQLARLISEAAARELTGFPALEKAVLIEHVSVVSKRSRGGRFQINMIEWLYATYMALPLDSHLWNDIQRKAMSAASFMGGNESESALYTNGLSRIFTEKLHLREFKEVLNSFKTIICEDSKDIGREQFDVAVLLGHAKPFQDLLYSYLQSLVPGVKLSRKGFSKQYRKEIAERKLEPEKGSGLTPAYKQVVKKVKAMSPHQRMTFQGQLEFQVASADEKVPKSLSDLFVKVGLDINKDVIDKEASLKRIADYISTPSQWSEPTRALSLESKTRHSDHDHDWVKIGGVANFFANRFIKSDNPKQSVIEPIFQLFFQEKLASIPETLRDLIVIEIKNRLTIIFMGSIKVAKRLDASVIKYLNLEKGILHARLVQPAEIKSDLGRKQKLKYAVKKDAPKAKLTMVSIKDGNTIEGITKQIKIYNSLDADVAYTDSEASYHGFDRLGKNFSDNMTTGIFREVEPFEMLFFELRRAYELQGGIILSRQGSHWTYDACYSKPLDQRKTAEHPDKQVLKVLLAMAMYIEMIIRIMIRQGDLVEYIEALTICLSGFIAQAANKESDLRQDPYACHLSFLQDIIQRLPPTWLTEMGVELASQAEQAQSDRESASIERIESKVSTKHIKLNSDIKGFFKLLFGLWSAVQKPITTEHTLFEADPDEEAGGTLISKVCQPQPQSEASLELLAALEEKEWASLKQYFHPKACLRSPLYRQAIIVALSSKLPGPLSPHWKDWTRLFAKHAFKLTTTRTHVVQGRVLSRTQDICFRSAAPKAVYDYKKEDQDDGDYDLKNLHTIVADNTSVGDDKQPVEVLIVTLNNLSLKPKKDDWREKSETAIVKSSLSLQDRSGESAAHITTISVPLVDGSWEGLSGATGGLICNIKQIKTFCERQQLDEKALPAICDIVSFVQRKTIFPSSAKRVALASRLSAWFTCGVWALGDAEIKYHFQDIKLCSRIDIYQQVINPLLEGERPTVALTPKHQAALLELLQRVKAFKRYKVLFHCAAGKDRTSVVHGYSDQYTRRIDHFLMTGRMHNSKVIFDSLFEMEILTGFIARTFPPAEGILEGARPGEGRSYPGFSEQNNEAICLSIAATAPKDIGFCEAREEGSIPKIFPQPKAPPAADRAAFDLVEPFSLYFSSMPLLQRIEQIHILLKDVGKLTPGYRIFIYRDNLRLALLKAFGITKGHACPDFLYDLLPPQLQACFITYPSKLRSYAIASRGKRFIDLPQEKQLVLCAELLAINLALSLPGGRPSSAARADDVLNVLLPLMQVIERKKTGEWCFYSKESNLQDGYNQLGSIFQHLQATGDLLPLFLTQTQMAEFREKGNLLHCSQATDIRDAYNQVCKFLLCYPQWYFSDAEDVQLIFDQWVKAANIAGYCNILAELIREPLAIRLLRQFYAGSTSTISITDELPIISTSAIPLRLYYSKTADIYYQVLMQYAIHQPVELFVFNWLKLQLLMHYPVMQLMFYVIKERLNVKGSLSHFHKALYRRISQELVYLGRLGLIEQADPGVRMCVVMYFFQLLLQLHFSGKVGDNALDSLSTFFPDYKSQESHSPLDPYMFQAGSVLGETCLAVRALLEDKGIFLDRVKTKYVQNKKGQIEETPKTGEIKEKDIAKAWEKITEFKCSPKQNMGLIADAILRHLLIKSEERIKHGAGGAANGRDIRAYYLYDCLRPLGVLEEVRSYNKSGEVAKYWVIKPTSIADIWASLKKKFFKGELYNLPDIKFLIDEIDALLVPEAPSSPSALLQVPLEKKQSGVGGIHSSLPVHLEVLEKLCAIIRNPIAVRILLIATGVRRSLDFETLPFGSLPDLPVVKKKIADAKGKGKGKEKQQIEPRSKKLEVGADDVQDDRYFYIILVLNTHLLGEMYNARDGFHSYLRCFAKLGYLSVQLQRLNLAFTTALFERKVFVDRIARVPNPSKEEDFELYRRFYGNCQSGIALKVYWQRENIGAMYFSTLNEDGFSKIVHCFSAGYMLADHEYRSAYSHDDSSQYDGGRERRPSVGERKADPTDFRLFHEYFVVEAYFIYQLGQLIPKMPLQHYVKWQRWVQAFYGKRDIYRSNELLSILRQLGCREALPQPFGDLVEKQQVAKAQALFTQWKAKNNTVWKRVFYSGEQQLNFFSDIIAAESKITQQHMAYAQQSAMGLSPIMVALYMASIQGQATVDNEKTYKISELQAMAGVCYQKGLLQFFDFKKGKGKLSNPGSVLLDIFKYLEISLILEQRTSSVYVKFNVASLGVSVDKLQAIARERRLAVEPKRDITAILFEQFNKTPNLALSIYLLHLAYLSHNYGVVVQLFLGILSEYSSMQEQIIAQMPAQLWETFENAMVNYLEQASEETDIVAQAWEDSHPSSRRNSIATLFSPKSKAGQGSSRISNSRLLCVRLTQFMEEILKTIHPFKEQIVTIARQLKLSDNTRLIHIAIRVLSKSTDSRLKHLAVMLDSLGHNGYLIEHPQDDINSIADVKHRMTLKQLKQVPEDKALNNYLYWGIVQACCVEQAEIPLSKWGFLIQTPQKKLESWWDAEQKVPPPPSRLRDGTTPTSSERPIMPLVLKSLYCLNQMLLAGGFKQVAVNKVPLEERYYLLGLLHSLMGRHYVDLPEIRRALEPLKKHLQKEIDKAASEAVPESLSL